MIDEKLIEYGITAEPSSYSNQSSNWEMGWMFTVVAESIRVAGLRVKYPVAQSTTGHLWDSSGKLLRSVVITAIAGSWVVALFDEPIELSAGGSYVISCYNTGNRYYTTSNQLTFNDKIHFDGGRYIANQGSFPSGAEPNNVYPMIDIVIDITPPYDKRYLIRSESVIYTVLDGALSALEDVELTAELFRTVGLEDTPDSELLITLVNPEILYWIDTTEHPMDAVMVTQIAIPFPQTLESPDYFMTDSTVLGIEKAIAVATDTVQFAVSFDSGATWKTFIGGTWAELSENSSGMSATTLNAIPTENWNAMTTNGKFRFRISLMDETSEFTSLIVDYLNEAEVPANSSEGDE